MARLGPHCRRKIYVPGSLGIAAYGEPETRTRTAILGRGILGPLGDWLYKFDYIDVTAYSKTVSRNCPVACGQIRFKCKNRGMLNVL